MTASRRASRPRGRVTFRGTMLGTSGSRGGIAISLEVFNRGRWRPFATPGTGPTGRWSYTYRFSRDSRGRFRFRARPQTSAVYPYTKGSSPIVAVRVR
jgi:hypothetical protein